MNNKRIAIACQGGGSQCAFVAGALRALFARRIQDRFQVVGLSGTSGGGFTAALAWAGLLAEARGDRTPIPDRILACWKDLEAQTPREIFLDGFCTQLMRLAEHGLLPTVATSPSSLRFQLWADAASRFIGRPEFTDLRALLLKHIDFAALPALVDARSPALLASAAIPTLFPAVEVSGHAYWDGIFASNPPVIGFLRAALMGPGKVPEEIWVIQVNRTRQDEVPEAPSDITDRRNHLAGNLSLRHELQVIEMINVLLQEGGLTDAFRRRFGFDTTEPITVRFIRMSKELEGGLDYPSKLSRLPHHIDRLIADGEAQAAAFLDGIGDAEAVPGSPVAPERARPERSA